MPEVWIRCGLKGVTGRIIGGGDHVIDIALPISDSCCAWYDGWVDGWMSFPPCKRSWAGRRSALLY